MSTSLNKSIDSNATQVKFRKRILNQRRVKELTFLILCRSAVRGMKRTGQRYSGPGLSLVNGCLVSGSRSSLKIFLLRPKLQSSQLELDCYRLESCI